MVRLIATVTWGENAATLPVNAASDLYYQVTPNANGYILVKNTGENLLSVTKLRTTNGNEQAGITTANVDDLLAYANTLTPWRRSPTPLSPARWRLKILR